MRHRPDDAISMIFVSFECESKYVPDGRRPDVLNPNATDATDATKKYRLCHGAGGRTKCNLVTRGAVRAHQSSPMAIEDVDRADVAFPRITGRSRELYVVIRQYKFVLRGGQRVLLSLEISYLVSALRSVTVSGEGIIDVL